MACCDIKQVLFFLGAFAIRVGLVFLADYMDKCEDTIGYTDTDYDVFSDAATHVRNGFNSPYARKTYRIRRMSFSPSHRVMWTGQVVSGLVQRMRTLGVSGFLAYLQKAKLALSANIAKRSGIRAVAACVRFLTLFATATGNSQLSWTLY